MTLAERILARASGRDRVEPGEIVVADIDRLILHDLSGYLTAKVYEERVGLPVAHPDRVVMVFDHIFSPPSEREADILEHNRAWARKRGVRVLDCGSGNIHNAVARAGLIAPGMVVVGSDSHTPVHGALGAFAAGLGNDSHAGLGLPYGKAWFRVPESIRVRLSGTPAPGSTARDVAIWLTGQIGEGGAVYKALEFCGPYVDSLCVFDRWLLPLIAVDVGAKSAAVEPDEMMLGYLRALGVDASRLAPPNADASYEEEREYDVDGLEPHVACPPTVGNVKAVSEVAGTPLQWVELGGHGGGRVEDFALARQDPRRPVQAPRRAAEPRPGQPRGVRRGGADGPCRTPARRRRHLVPAQHGLQPGGEHGRDGGGGADALHPLAQLPGAQRQHRGRDVPRLGSDGGGLGGGRADHRSEGLVVIRGRCWMVGDYVPTDQIVKSARVFLPMEEIVPHVLEDANPRFAGGVSPGDVLVAGKHFGQSSGRAIAPKALAATGLGCIVAEYFSRTFYRNAFEIGLPVLELPGVTDAVREGDELSVDVEAGTLRCERTGDTLTGEPTDPFLLDMLHAGGLIPMAKTLAERPR